MSKPSSPDKQELLAIAAEVIAGERESSELAAHGITIGDRTDGEAAKAQLLEALDREEAADRALADHCRAAESLWSRMAGQGVQEGSIGRFEARFVAKDRRNAEVLAADFELLGEGWKSEIVSDTAHGLFRVNVITRPVVLGLEVVVELTKMMATGAQDFGCDFVGLEPAPVPRSRRWWRFW